MASKVLIIGLDGGTWKILKPMMDSGTMPNLKRLAENGALGILQSTVPPVTAPAWASFQTGVNPGKHGIYDFQTFDRETNELRLVNADSLNYPTIWELAAKSKKKVITVNVPLTYPPKEIENWIQVGGLLSPKVSQDFVYPKALFAKIQKSGYRIGMKSLNNKFNMTLDEFIDEEISIEERRSNLAKELLQETDWDLCMVHNQSMDEIQHVYYPYLDPRCPEHERTDFDKIARFYEKTDSFIGDLLRTVGPSATVIVVSDHGFKIVGKKININNWLWKKGILKFDKRRRLTKDIIQFMMRLDVLNFRQKIGSKIVKKFGETKFASASNKYFIDWENTKACMLNGNTYGNLFLNCTEKEREGLLPKIREDLSKLIDNENGAKVVKNIFEANEIFEGPSVNNLPDLFIEPEEAYTFAMSILSSRKIFPKHVKNDFWGSHDRNGIFVVNGPNVRKILAGTKSIFDIAPTVLSVLGIRVPKWIDGQAMQNLFVERLNVQFSDEGMDHHSKSRKRSEDEKAIRERLRGLGYI